VLLLGPARQLDRALQEPAGVGQVHAGPGEALERGLVAGRGDDARARREVVAVDGDDRLGVVLQRLRRPQGRRDVVPAALQLAGQAAVERQGRDGERRREGLWRRVGAGGVERPRVQRRNAFGSSPVDFL
jgi:hypothetical protein